VGSAWVAAASRFRCEGRRPLAHGKQVARDSFETSIAEGTSASRIFVRRGRLPQILLGQERIIVAPQQEMYELACAYAAQQRDFGNVEPQVVRAIWDAYRMLDLEQSDFRPVP